MDVRFPGVRFPLVVSYYTKNTLYEIEAHNLIASCQKFGLPHLIEGIDSFGSWEINCAFKPFFIMKKVVELQQPILWVDADGMFCGSPSWIPEFDGDFAVRFSPEASETHPSKVISNTVFSAYTPAALALLAEWAEECKRQLLQPGRDREFWDQIALRDVLAHWKDKAVVHSMPIAYSKIFDKKSDIDAAPTSIIEHYQASRRYKHLVNEDGSEKRASLTRAFLFHSLGEAISTIAPKS